MGRFRPFRSQAEHALRQYAAFGTPRHGESRRNGKITSVGTFETRVASLCCAIKRFVEDRLDPEFRGIKSLTKEQAMLYLEIRSEEVGQKQLDKDRQALQMVLREELPRLQSEVEVVASSRAYTSRQLELIAEAQTPFLALVTEIADAGGLRAHELLTLRRLEERGPSPHRPWADARFLGRSDFIRYTVIGKGGLIREVAISHSVSRRLEERRLAVPKTIVDRKIKYQSHYDLPGGKRWTDSFAAASRRQLGWTNGAHGTRHGYAQRRMNQLQAIGTNFHDALSIVSQELGHFRPGITLVYLR